jgi:hypothetical protein
MKYGNLIWSILILSACIGLFFVEYKNYGINQQKVEEYKKLQTLLEQYKPMTISTTLQMDENFMKTLVFRLQNDTEFVSKVANSKPKD